jgi:SAM-dependent methyltransferase
MSLNKQKTIDTYNASAVVLAKKYDEQGVMIKDIDYVFSLIKKSNPVVLEIGCGSGRDAQEIIKRTNHYTGVDVSKNLLLIAKEKVPQATFINEDIETFKFPNSIDIVFGFASLLHVSKDSLKNILINAYNALNDDGVVYISLKYADTYVEYLKKDEYGERVFYLYSPKDIQEIIGKFKILKNVTKDYNNETWLEIYLQK